MRLAYRVAYFAARIFWFLFRPRTRGVYVAVWYRDRVLMIKNSYKRELTFPCGGIRQGESPRRGAVRELAEEAGIRVPLNALRYVGQYFTTCEYCRDQSDLYEITFPDPPDFFVDHREVVWAGFMTPEETLKQRLFPIVAEYLSGKSSE